MSANDCLILHIFPMDDGEIREEVPLLCRKRMGRCVAQPIIPSIHKSAVPPRDGSLRFLYAARLGHCRGCSLRAQCQESVTTLKARRVSAVYWPLSSPSAISDPSPPPPRIPSAASFPLPVLWKDWPRCLHRREVVKLLAHQRVEICAASTWIAFASWKSMALPAWGSGSKHNQSRCWAWN
jgi:hypothetical protein